MDNTPLIEFKGVTKSFGSRTILHKVDLKLYEGEVTTIIGLSGTGKSVLLKHIIGLLTPDEGEILFRGKPIHSMSKSERDKYLSQISYMFQNNALFDSMTVFENVALPLSQTTSLKKKEIERRVMARIEQTELTEVAHKYPSEISGGMQKRAALARALVTDPQIVLFDEPTTGQDPIRKNAILTMVAEYQKQFGFTAVLISHEIPDVFFISNRILALYDKKIIFQGTPEELENFDHPFRDEVLRSLEVLEEGLTGLYSRRQFKVRYQTDLYRQKPDQTYAVVLFRIDDLEEIIEKLGHTAAQALIRSLGSYINKHFGTVGGFSTRYSINEYTTILPYSDVDEAEKILQDFASDFQARGLAAVESVIKEEKRPAERVDFTVYAGIGQGKAQVELESVIEFAKFQEKEIARFSCAVGGSE
ncbi:MAG: ATP-binding cassette domain-containing protein [Deltaproteobacteria bacterium]|nr:ATP-binding cassette domain-containing protein [Deltaproteobacteria bacterium]MBW2072565.1 ATP-binding cassette domain-containing protein [Deltaproteobacteria bacterium]